MNRESLLSLQGIHVRRSGALILNIDHLAVQRGEILAVIGPNGAGKSTLLSAISGLIPLSRGSMSFAGKSISPFDDLLFRRRLALVMQDPLLLHASVFENVAAGLKFRGVKRAAYREQVEFWLQRFSIGALSSRPAQRLSGGEAQRVSLARAFVLQPELLLLDEPFSALDAPTRTQLLIDLKNLLTETRVTTLLVTHDLDEAATLADRMVVLMQGGMRQVDAPASIFRKPVDLEVARFVGMETILPGKIIRQNGGHVDVACERGVFAAHSVLRAGSSVALCIRPEDVPLTLPKPLSEIPAASFVARIEAVLPQGPLLRVILGGEPPAIALVSHSQAAAGQVAAGQEVQVTFPAEAIHLIPV